MIFIPSTKILLDASCESILVLEPMRGVDVGIYGSISLVLLVGI